MPTYEYECTSCAHTFDVFQSMADEPIKICPVCGKTVRRLISGGSGVIFKGSGFYVTDKGGGKAASPASTTAAESKPASGTATETKAGGSVSGDGAKPAETATGSGTSGDAGKSSAKKTDTAAP